MVELVNANQFTRRAGLSPRPPYSRIVQLELFTTAGNNKTDEQDSPVLASRGILLAVWIHIHHSAVQTAGSGIVWLGFNQQTPLGADGGTTFRNRIISTYGGPADAISIEGVDLDYEMHMAVQFSGDKTKLSAACRTFNNFTTRMQLFFQIAEG
ncbi:MAG: hypothetical protein KAT00_02215 [Planctomycetes bacterium]|nr:hypothetical protein [Planctomycetota bacterium]